MAVAEIKLVSIIGLMENLEKVAEICGATENFQPDDARGFYADTRNFLPIAAQNYYALPLDKLKNALDLAQIKRKIIKLKNFNPNLEKLNSYVDKVSGELQKLTANKVQAQKNIEKCRRLIEETSHFLGLDIELNKVFECEYIKANFGRLPKESFDKLAAYDDNPYVTFFPCTVDSTHYWGVYISPVDESYEIDRIFSGLYFEHYQIEGMEGTPKEFNEKQQRLLPQLIKNLEEAQSQIDSYLNRNLKEIIKYYSKLEQLNTYYIIENKALQYHDSFILVGWIPASLEKEIRTKLLKIDSVNCEFSTGKEELKSSPPVILKNFFLAKPFEFYTQMYGLPRYNEIDPTKFIAVTYSILFGVMFGDVGHGLMLLIAAIIMWYVKKMPLGKILIPCAVTSTVFGFVFGSVFGFEEILNPLYKALFGWDSKPIHVLSTNDTNTIIYSAIGVGVLLILFAMFLSIYSNLKRGCIGQALFGVNGVSGLVFYGATVFGLVGQMFLNMQILTLPYVLLLIVLPFALIYLNGPLSKLVAKEKNWQPQSWGGYMVENFFECFEVILSFISNTMSFIRVGAFVLVHAGMMEVVFILAQMSSGVGYWIIVVIGNFIVMGLEALLVGIQVLRLEYYEMFSRFYIGDGRAFEPVKVIESI